MNHEIRNYLIDQCVKGKPIYYEDVGNKLGLNLELQSDRLILSKTLGEISTFEHNNNRPLISSIVIYKVKNDHGYGFYNLCEKLGLGKATSLRNKLFGFLEMDKSKIFWQKGLNHKSYYVLNKSIKITPNTLSLKNMPVDGITELPELKPNFKGVYVDYVKKHKHDKDLGDAGELLVKEIEVKKLKLLKKANLAKKVRIAKDGEGFDVLSYNEEGNTIYIEVKATKDDKKTPFYLSLNEKLFGERNKETYYIYRLYNYDDVNNIADYFIISDPMNELLFQPIDYKVYLKEK